MSTGVTRRLKRLVKRTALYRNWNERVLARSLGAWTEHDERRKQFYAQFIRPGDVCFDVGANVGNRTKVFVGLGAKVVSVEPQPACMRVLRRVYANDARVALVPAALGSTPGKTEMMVSSIVPTLSSLSQVWVEAVKASGRFADCEWDQKLMVELTTLDRLIAQHGRPAFIKIDVEGFEHEVLKGLTQPVEALSFEFTPECFATTERCLKHLANLGRITVNYSIGESAVLHHDRWLTADEVLSELSAITDIATFGDVYVRFANGSRNDGAVGG